MKNWAGNFEFFPTDIFAPFSTEEAQKIVQDHISSNKSIRVRGSSHSWTPLIQSNESFLHLDNMQGITNVDSANALVTAKAGTKLSKFLKDAFAHQLALPNQGDIDVQSIAGALSTGTHGTGIALQSVSNQIRGLTLITGTGDCVKIDAQNNSDYSKAASVSLGSLGLMTEVTLQAIPAYKLKVEIWNEDITTCLAELRTRVQQNRHYEVFYFPLGDWCLSKKMNMTQEPCSRFFKMHRLNNLVMENWVYEAMVNLAHKTNSHKKIDKIIRTFASPKSFVNWSYLAFPTQRTVRFMEMEYNLPYEKFEEVFDEIKASIKKHNFNTLFPIEIRFVKGDDLWLSPAYGRDSVYFAVHTYIKEDFRPYFLAMENIFKKHGGRPHWGKWHSMNHNEFEKCYPKWNDFKQLRLQLDPKGLWLNPYLKGLFAV